MANTKQAQIKINLSEPLKDYVDKRAVQYGFTTANYIKHLILRDAQSVEYQTYQTHKSKIVNTKYMAQIKKLDKQAKEIKGHLHDPQPNKYIAGQALNAQDLINQLEKDE